MSRNALGVTMKQKALAFVLCAAMLIISAPATAEVAVLHFAGGAWEPEAGLYGRKLDFEVDLGFGLAAVDSVQVRLTGTSHMGICYLSTQGSLACWDFIKVYMRDETPQTSCDALLPDPSADPGCIASMYAAPGNLEPFDVQLQISAIELIAARPNEYAVVDPAPELGPVFADGRATIRLVRVDGGHYEYRCRDGLADVDQVVVSVFYNPALPSETQTWGALKAQYR
jgi:hypothetical protein